MAAGVTSNQRKVTRTRPHPSCYLLLFTFDFCLPPSAYRPPHTGLPEEEGGNGQRAGGVAERQPAGIPDTGGARDGGGAGAAILAACGGGGGATNTAGSGATSVQPTNGAAKASAAP